LIRIPVGKANDRRILRLLIRIPVGKANDHGIRNDFRSEFQSEKPTGNRIFEELFSHHQFC